MCMCTLGLLSWREAVVQRGNPHRPCSRTHTHPHPLTHTPINTTNKHKCTDTYGHTFAYSYTYVYNMVLSTNVSTLMHNTQNIHTETCKQMGHRHTKYSGKHTNTHRPAHRPEKTSNETQIHTLNLDIGR